MGEERGGVADGAANMIRGVLMGAADAIPGVSGGTIALIVGIYERLINAISGFDLGFVRLVFSGKFAEAARRIDFGFLLVLGTGILVGAGVSLTFVHYLLEEHFSLTLAGFFGLILGSSIIVAGMIRRRSPISLIALVAGIIFAFLVCGGNTAGSVLPFSPEFQESKGYVVICGMIAICAMILPGISGSYILYLLGQYFRITGAIKELIKLRGTWDDFTLAALFGIGCVIGLITFTKLLRWLLAHAHDATLAGLCGFMIGSLRLLWPFKESPAEGFAPNVLPASVGETWLPLGIAICGFVFVLGLHRIASPGSGRGV